MLTGFLNRKRSQTVPTSSLVIEVTERIVPIGHPSERRFTAVPLKEPRSIWNSKQAFSSKIEYWGWKIGYLWFDVGLNRWKISLAMNTNLIRKSGIGMLGWDGEEEHIASFCVLQDGDRLQWARIGVGLYEDEPWHLYPNLVVTIAEAKLSE